MRSSPTFLISRLVVALLVLAENVSAFVIVNDLSSVRLVAGVGEEEARKRPEDASSPSCSRSHSASSSSFSWRLFMGRAAAVRAKSKARTDGLKAKTNAVFGKRIIMAVKDGGSPDPNANRALFDVMKQAKAANVPVDNINRAIKRASEASVGDFKESIFEAYGFGGASFVINVLTDNNNRATSDIKNVVKMREGKIAEPGSVLFLYDRKGKIQVNAELDEEKVLEAAIEAGCDDMEFLPQEGDDDDEDGAATVIYTDPKEVSLMMDAVKSLGYEEGATMALAFIAKAPVECSDEDFDKNMQIIDALEELDDVDSVEHNMSN